MRYIKQNILLILGFALPAAVLLAIGLMAILPSFFVRPTVNFAYVVSDNSYGPLMYRVEAEKLIQTQDTPIDSSYIPYRDTRFFIHDTKNNTNKEISFTELQNIALSSSTISPDGFTFEQGTRGGGGVFPFWYGDSSGRDSYYLVGNGIRHKLQLELGVNQYSAPQFLGWVK